jgi:hypothetical protein
MHDLWIDPDAPAHLVVGNDGGGAVSTNTGGKWTAQDYPTEQFYHAITTKHIPYHVCGSQQDNSTLCTPFNWNQAAFTAAQTPGGRGGGRGGRGGAANPDSTPPVLGANDITLGGMDVSYQAGGGEPGYIGPDPRDPDLFYSGTNNGGYLDKYNRRTGISREVNPYPWFYSANRRRTSRSAGSGRTRSSSLRSTRERCTCRRSGYGARWTADARGTVSAATSRATRQRHRRSLAARSPAT